MPSNSWHFDGKNWRCRQTRRGFNLCRMVLVGFDAWLAIQSVASATISALNDPRTSNSCCLIAQWLGGKQTTLSRTNGRFMKNISKRCDIVLFNTLGSI